MAELEDAVANVYRMTEGEPRAMGGWPSTEQLIDGIPEGAEVSATPESTNYIISKLLPEIADKMIRDGRHYGGSNHRVLGLAGQFSDIWRKIGPLKKQMWDGEEPVRENTRTILLDLVGHCLLSLEMLDRQDPPRGTWL